MHKWQKFKLTFIKIPWARYLDRCTFVTDWPWFGFISNRIFDEINIYRRKIFTLYRFYYCHAKYRPIANRTCATSILYCFTCFLNKYKLGARLLNTLVFIFLKSTRCGRNSRCYFRNYKRARLDDQCFLPLLMCGAETWVCTKEILQKLQMTQRAIER